jgi:solute carrier family 35 protein E3
MAWLLVLIAISFCTATSLILTNKKVMNNYGFECPTFLTSYHFLLSTVVFFVMTKMNLFRADKSVPPFARWSTASFGVASIVFLNLNLKVNSIGFYQLSKLCNIPCMVVYKLIFKNQGTPIQSLLSLAVLLVGLALFTVNDVEFNIPVSVIAIIAVLSTTVWQSRSSYMQGEYGITGPQFNELIAFPQFVICFVAALLAETHGSKSILIHQFQTIEIGLILLTGLFAAYGNVIGFIMIGQTGPVTFQVIGHVKTILIFVFGLIMFPPKVAESPEQHRKKLTGLSISMIGVFLYTYFELRLKEQAKQREAARDNEKEEKNADVDTLLAHRPTEGIFQTKEPEQDPAHSSE